MEEAYTATDSTMKTTIKSLTRTMPLKVRDLIFARLDLPSKKITRRVCRKWRYLTDQLLSFRVMLTEDTIHFVQGFGRRRPVTELIVGFFSQPYPKKGWNLNVKALSILADYRYEVFYKEAEIDGEFQPPQPSLAMVVMPQSKLGRLFKEFKNSSKITVSSMALVDVKGGSFLKSLRFGNLVKLDIATELDYGMEAVKDIFLNHFPQLQDLSLVVNNEDDMTLYSELFTFINKHSNSLKSLKWDYLGASAIHHSDKNNNRERTDEIVNTQRDLKLDHVAYADILLALKKVILTHVNLYLLSSEGRGRKNLELHMLQGQTNLVSLKLTNLRPENMPVWRSIPSIISACSETLELIMLDGCFCEHDVKDPPGPFPGTWVQNCSKLHTLEFLVCGVKVTELRMIPSKKLKTLCLGHVLSPKQIRIILENYTGLQQLSLPQSRKPMTNTGNPNVSLEHFISALKMPFLSKLILSSSSCRHRKIRKHASSLIGVVESLIKLPNHSVSKRGDVEFLIDRRMFTYREEDHHKIKREKSTSASRKIKRDCNLGSKQEEGVIVGV